MSAPDRDLEQQTKRHRGPLRGMFAVVLFALVLLALLGFWVAGSPPERDAAQVQSGTGVVESGETDDAVSANNVVDEEEQGVGGVVADPTAVTVPSLQVQHPQDGQASDAEQNPLTGASDTAVPLDPAPVEEGGEGVVVN